MHELIFGTRWAVFTKIESQQGPKERTFLAGLREDVVVEAEGTRRTSEETTFLTAFLAFFRLI
jgi:hypothetical protein